MAKKAIDTSSDTAPEAENLTSGKIGVEVAPEAQWKTVSSRIWKPQPGDFLIGVYQGDEPISDELRAQMKDAEGRDIRLHFFEVNGDRYSMIGGQIFDNIIKTHAPVGTLCRIEYLGQRNTKNNNRCNEWDVKIAMSK